MSNNYTVAQLERLLQRKRARLEGLIQKRDRLQKSLSRVERQIAEIGGAVPAGTALRKPRKRPKNGKTLLQTVHEVLTQHKKGLSLKDLTSKVLESGYKTGSTNFQNTVYQCLYHNQDHLAHDPKSHTYRIK